MGLPLRRGADCALRELSPSWGPPPQTRKTVENEMMKEGWSGKKMLSGNNGRFGEETLIPQTCFPYSTNAHHTFRYQPFVRHKLLFFIFFSN